VAGVEELARVAEVRVDADAAELVGSDVDARCTVLTVGVDARTGCLASLTVEPLGALAPAHTLRKRLLTTNDPVNV